MERNSILFYPGAGCDMKNPLCRSTANVFIFEDRVDPCFGSLEEQIEKICTQIEKEKGQIVSKNFVGDVLDVVFWHDGVEKRLRYYFYKDVRTFLPPEIEDGYDVYFCKGSGPFCYPLYLSKIINFLNLGSCFFDYRGSLNEYCLVRNGEKTSISGVFDLEKLGLGCLGYITEINQGLLNIQVGKEIIKRKVKRKRKIVLYEKLRNIDREALLGIILPVYLDLAVLDLEGLLGEYRQRPGSFFVKNTSWKEHIVYLLEELDYLLKLNPIDKYREALVYFKLEFAKFGF